MRTGQQYDDRGRPINPETTQRTKDLVRASNEVLQAAGIIEPNADFRARDEALKAAQEEDFDKAFRRRTIGGVLLTAGVWGTSGLRRRTLVCFNGRVFIRGSANYSSSIGNILTTLYWTSFVLSA